MAKVEVQEGGPFNITDLGGMNTPFDIFTSPKVETSIEGGIDTPYYTPSNLNNADTIEFTIPGSDTHIDLSKTRLHGKFKIVKPNAQGQATDTIATDDFSISNCFVSSLFEMLKVYIDGVEVQTNMTSAYPYKAFIETLFSFSKDAKENMLKASSLWIQDKSGTEAVNTKTDNSAYNDRANIVKLSKSVEFSTKLHADIFQCRKYLLPGIPLRVKLVRHADSFGIIAKNNDVKYKVQLEQLKLTVRHLKIAKNIANAQLHFLDSQPGHYWFPKTEIIHHVVGPNISSKIVDRIATGLLPHLIIVGMVKDTAAEGHDYSKNPFHFENFGLNSLQFRVNGVMIPSETYKPVYGDTMAATYCLREYNDLCKILKLEEGAVVPISKEEFATGLNFYALDLSGHNCGLYSHIPKLGVVDLSLGFKTQLTEAVRVIQYSVYLGKMKVDDKLKVQIEV